MDHYCVDRGAEVVHEVSEFHPAGAVQAMALHSKVWPQNSTVRIGFIGGSQYERSLVHQVVMRDYAPYVNLNLQVVDSDQAEIRVAFMRGQGAWSMVGRDALDIPRNQPTMNLGFLDDNPPPADDCCLGVLKHELGHMLAWVHEHQSPAAPIQWNKPVVIAHLSGPPNNWNRAQIQRNMFDRYDHAELRGLVYDKDSIMHYVFPREWTLNGVISKPNQFLSSQDIMSLQLTYPRANNPRASLGGLGQVPASQKPHLAQNGPYGVAQGTSRGRAPWRQGRLLCHPPGW